MNTQKLKHVFLNWEFLAALIFVVALFWLFYVTEDWGTVKEADSDRVRVSEIATAISDICSRIERLKGAGHAVSADLEKFMINECAGKHDPRSLPLGN